MPQICTMEAMGVLWPETWGFGFLTLLGTSHHGACVTKQLGEQREVNSNVNLSQALRPPFLQSGRCFSSFRFRHLAASAFTITATCRAAAHNLFGTRDGFRGRQFSMVLGVWDGFGMIEVHYIQAHLLLGPNRPGLVPVCGPEVGDLCFRGLPGLGQRE